MVKRLVVFLFTFVIALIFTSVAFGASPESDFVFDSSTGTITKYVGLGGIVEIPSVIGGVAVNSVGESAFEDNDNLQSITIPDGVTSIGMQAFAACDYLKTVTIPNGVTIIGDYAFSGCLRLSSLAIPQGLNSINEGTFSGCISLASISVPSGVTSIKRYAFRGCANLSSISMPDSVASIESEAFGQCKSLISLTIPKGVSSIESGAFSECLSLQSFKVSNLNSSFTSLGGVLFDKEAVTLVQYPLGRVDSTYVIPSGVLSVGSQAFYSCSQIVKLTIPNSVKSIGQLAFARCTSLASVAVPGSVTFIGDSAFAGCTSLNSVIMQDGVLSIGDGVFSGCSSLRKVGLPKSLKSIGASAFAGCSVLAELIIPHGVEFIGSDAFPIGQRWAPYDGYFTTLTIPGDIRDMNAVIPGSVRTLTIAQGSTSVQKYQWKAIKYLYTLVIPEGVARIEANAFQGAALLTSVQIPSTVSEVQSGAFQGCLRLSNALFIGAAPTEFGADVFAGCASGFQVNYYPSTNGWSTPFWKEYRAEAMFAVTFINGSSAVTKPVLFNTQTSIASPARTGYRFMGWYSLTGVKFNSAIPVVSDATYFARWYSTNADLSKLTASTGSWSHRFSKTRLNYTLVIAASKSSVKVVATRASKYSKIAWSYNKTTWSSGTTKTVSVSKGKYKYLYFKVKAQSGVYKIYAVKVYRKR